MGPRSYLVPGIVTFYDIRIMYIQVGLGPTVPGTWYYFTTDIIQSLPGTRVLVPGTVHNKLIVYGTTSTNPTKIAIYRELVRLPEWSIGYKWPVFYIFLWGLNTFYFLL